MDNSSAHLEYIQCVLLTQSPGNLIAPPLAVRRTPVGA